MRFEPTAFCGARSTGLLVLRRLMIRGPVLGEADRILAAFAFRLAWMIVCTEMKRTNFVPAIVTVVAPCWYALTAVDRCAGKGGAVFVLDERLEADSIAVGVRDGCLVRLFRDARYPWLLVIPAMGRFREWWELAPDRRTAVDGVLADCARVLAALPGVEKTNLASLGNLVPQLHWHVVGRRAGDPAWPGPVWGNGTPQSYDPGKQTALIAHLRIELRLAPEPTGPTGSDQGKILFSMKNLPKNTVD